MAFALPFLYTIVKDAKTRRIEAEKPHLEHQLKLYTEICQVVARLASDQIEADSKRSWELYWGELCMVETLGVETAMKEFGDALLDNAGKEKLQGLSYNLAHALRQSLESGWGSRFHFRWLPGMNRQSRLPIK